MKLPSKLIFQTILLLSPISPIYAQVYNCNGIISNTPCEGGVLIAPPLPTRSAEDLLRADESRKQTLLLQLSNKISEVQRKHNLDINVSDTEIICRDGTLSECSESVRLREKEIDERVLLKLKIANESKILTPTPNQVESPKIIERQITIIDNRNNIIERPNHHKSQYPHVKPTVGLSMPGMRPLPNP